MVTTREAGEAEAVHGLRVTVSGAELVEQCQARARHHSEQVARIEGLGEGLHVKEDAPGPGALLSELETRRASSTRRARYFDYLAAHLAEDHDYELSVKELVDLELVPPQPAPRGRRGAGPRTGGRAASRRARH